MSKLIPITAQHWKLLFLFTQDEKQEGRKKELRYKIPRFRLFSRAVYASSLIEGNLILPPVRLRPDVHVFCCFELRSGFSISGRLRRQRFKREKLIRTPTCLIEPYGSLWSLLRLARTSSFSVRNSSFVEAK